MPVELSTHFQQNNKKSFLKSLAVVSSLLLCAQEPWESFVVSSRPNIINQRGMVRKGISTILVIG